MCHLKIKEMNKKLNSRKKLLYDLIVSNASGHNIKIRQGLIKNVKCASKFITKANMYDKCK